MLFEHIYFINTKYKKENKNMGSMPTAVTRTSLAVLSCVIPLVIFTLIDMLSLL